MGNRGARLFVQRGCAIAECVQPTVHVRVVLAVVSGHFFDYRGRALSRGGVVQVDKRMPVDHLR